MSSPSNLYAEKVYAEQPTALWALDDSADFISFFSNSLSLSSWTKTGTFNLSNVTEITSTYPQIQGASFVKITTSSTATITSVDTITTSENFSAGIWLNIKSPISSVVFTVDSLTKTFDVSGVYDSWIYLNHIFEVDSPLSNEAFSITFNYTGSSSIDIYANAFSIGIGQNIFGTKSVGSHLSSAPESLYGLEAFEYGLGQNSGWYIGDNTTKKLYAVNSSVPLVYGASASTKLIENPNGPSLIIPSMGFLNESGKSQVSVFEAWMRIRTDGNSSTTPFRIFGPTESSDGLYVNGQHLIIKVGNEYSSHYVGEWFRPMLINIEFTKEKVSLLVNGEIVASIETDTSKFPSYTNQYLGFYVGGNVEFIELDCVAIYPYKIAATLAKRRFGYGQAVELPSEIEKAYSGQNISIDYTYANYSFDYQYPSIESWKSSVFENVYVDANIMGSPKSQEPSIILSKNADISEWKSAVSAINESSSDTYPYIKMVPNSTWESDGINGYMYLKRLKQPAMPMPKSIYVVAKANSSYSDRDQVVFKLQDRETLDNISVVLSGTKLYYNYNIADQEGTLGYVTVSSGSKFVAGIDFEALLSSINVSLSKVRTNSAIINFIKSRQLLELYVGGDYSGTDNEISTTFMGNIYKFGMSTRTNFIKTGMSSLFNTKFAIATKHAEMMSLTGSYEYCNNKITFNDDKIYDFTAQSSSYWQDYLSLKKIAKTTHLEDGSETYVADTIQISIDANGSSSVVSGNIDSSLNNVKTYVYFTYSTSYLSNFGISQSTVVALDESHVVDARSNWSGKKYEVVDGAVIYLPQSGFINGKKQEDLIMVTVVEMVSKSTNKLPIKIRSLQYAGQTFDRRKSTIFNSTYAKPIGVRSGKTSIYPYSYSNGSYDYSSYNPVTINKSMSPYLYLTNKSGIKVLDSYGDENDRGIYIPINPNASQLYKVSLVSMYLMFNDNSFNSEISIAEIYDIKYGKIKIMLVPTSDTSVAKIIIKTFVDNAWVELSTVEVYINGTYVTAPTLSVKQWANIGILFPVSPLDFSNTSESRMEITGSVLINNISYYQLRAEELAQQVIPNEWNDYDNGDHAWSAYDTELTWSTVAASEAYIRPELSPTTIFNVYSGTNRIFATSDNDLTGLSLGNYKYDIIDDVVWQNNVTVSP